MKKPVIKANNLVIYKHRKLPHWQAGGCWYFITFRSRVAPLPEDARDTIKQIVVLDHGVKYILSAAVIMPDHVHLLIMPLEKEDGCYFSLDEILKPIKGASAQSINKILQRNGAVWQKESFDRIVRDEKEWLEKYEYIQNNPLKAGIEGVYQWLVVGDGFANGY